jgi:hypothetical protein
MNRLEYLPPHRQSAYDSGEFAKTTAGGSMQRAARWLVAVLVPLIAFGGSAAILMTVRFGWTPSAQSDRWTVSFAIAAFVGAALGGPLAWWAGHEQPDQDEHTKPDQSPDRVSQKATLGPNSQNYMSGQDMKIDHGGRRRK